MTVGAQNQEKLSEAFSHFTGGLEAVLEKKKLEQTYIYIKI